MGIPMYLAMTAAEVSACKKLPEYFAYMACHFSSYGSGLSNLPAQLPPGSLIMVNDRIPFHHHDTNKIQQQLLELAFRLQPAGIVLDFQRDEPALLPLADSIISALPCPVAISDRYAKDLHCPIFLQPVPPHLSLSEHIHQWHDREIWLDLAPVSCQFTISETNSICTPLLDIPPDLPFYDTERFVHYSITENQDTLVFSLVRTKEQAYQMLLNAPTSVRFAIGLNQQLHEV